MFFGRNFLDLPVPLNAANDHLRRIQTSRALRQRNNAKMKRRTHDVETSIIAETPPPAPHPRPSIPISLLDKCRSSQPKHNSDGKNTSFNSLTQSFTDVGASRQTYRIERSTGRNSRNVNAFIRIEEPKIRIRALHNRKWRYRSRTASRILPRQKKTFRIINTIKHSANRRAMSHIKRTAEVDIYRHLELVKELLAVPTSFLPFTDDTSALNKTKCEFVRTNGSTSSARPSCESICKSTNRRYPQQTVSRENEAVDYEANEVFELENALRNALTHVASTSLSSPISTPDKRALSKHVEGAQKRADDWIKTSPNSLRTAFVEAMHDFKVFLSSK